MGILDAPSVSVAQARAANPSNVATRIPVCRMGTFDNTTAKTFQATFELVDDFDAVRIIFGSGDPDVSTVVTKASVTAPASAADVNNSAGSWTAVTKQGQAMIATPVAPNGTETAAFTVSDWIALPSVARSDGGTYPLLTVRAFIVSNATLSVLGNGTDSFTNWASRSDGRKFVWRHQNGDQITTPSGFTSTTNQSQSPIIGVQYLCRGQVVTVGAVGDSITEGRGTYLGEGFVLPALEELNAAGGPIKYEYANFGWSGQTSPHYTLRGLYMLESELRPDIVVIPAGSPNDTGGSLTSAIVSAISSERGRLIAAARENGVVPVVWTWLPCNTAVHNWGSSDSLRTAYNTQVVAGASRNLLVADTSTAVSGLTSSGQVQFTVGMTTDGIHPNNTGNTALTAVIKPVLAKAGVKSQGGARRRSSRADAPAYGVSEATFTIPGSGVWVYRRVGAGTWTLPPLNPDPVRQDSQIITVKAATTSDGLFVSRAGSDVINIGGVGATSALVKTGQSVTFIPGGNAKWEVLGLETYTAESIAFSSAGTLTLDKTASVFVFNGSTATWTLPYPRHSTGQSYWLVNTGAGTLTVQQGNASEPIYSGGTTVSSITIAAGKSRRVIYSGSGGPYWLTDTGLDNVNNTSDANKPVSTAQQAALDGKQPLDSDLTAIAAITTTTFGRSLLTAVDETALLDSLGIGNYEGEAIALFDRMTVRPDFDRRAAINTLIVTLKDNDLWDRLDGLYLFAAHTQQAALLNWCRSFANFSAVNSPTFTADTGFTGDGVSSSLTNTNAGTVNTAGDDITVTTWVADAGTEVSQYFMWWTNWGVAWYFDSSSHFWYTVSDSTAGDAGLVADTGLFSMSRSSSAARVAYLDGAQIHTSSTAVDGGLSHATTAPIVLMSDTGTGFVDLTLSSFSYGGSMNSSEQAIFYNAVNDYMTAVGL